MFTKRIQVYLSKPEHYSAVAGSVRVTPFGADSVSRRGIITASQTANVLSLGYQTRERFLKSLTPGYQDLGNLPSDFEVNAKNHGHKFEKEAALLFQERMRHRLKPLTRSDEQLTFTMAFEGADKPFHVGATPDQVYLDEEKHQMNLLEIKCPYRKWLDQSDISIEDEAWSLVSDKHYIQCQMQLLITKLKEMYLFFYVPRRDDAKSENTALWLVREDPAFQEFLLANIEQAYREIRNNFTSQYKTIRNEGTHNRTITSESKTRHCTFLIP